MRYRHQQDLGAIGQGVIRIRSGRQQLLHGFWIVLDGGKYQGRKAALRCGADIGLVVDQDLHHFRVPFGCRPHQRGLPLARFRQVDIGAVRDQLLHHVDAARVGGNHERRLAVPAGGTGVRPGLQQLRDQNRVSVGRGQGERRLAILIGGLHVGAGGQQEVGRLAVVQVGGPRQRRGAVGLRRIDVGVLREQHGDGLMVAAFDGLRQAKIAGGPSGGGEPGLPPCRIAPRFCVA